MSLEKLLERLERQKVEAERINVLSKQGLLVKEKCAVFIESEGVDEISEELYKRIARQLHLPVIVFCKVLEERLEWECGSVVYKKLPRVASEGEIGITEEDIVASDIVMWVEVMSE